MGHNHLLKIRLLEKSARHDFIIARHRSSNNIFSCQLLESSLGINLIRAVSLLVKKILTARIATARQKH
jgi:hypothetical protein